LKLRSQDHLIPPERLRRQVISSADSAARNTEMLAVLEFPARQDKLRLGYGLIMQDLKNPQII
jgi:hypothetical protein